MSQEIIYTSSPQGLRPGSFGFCTVATTPGMATSLAERLEALSGYRHPHPPGDPHNPVVYSHLLLKVGGQRLHVLSRIADAGLDYSQRTNKLAHHVALDVNELTPAGPAWVLSQPGFCETKWHGSPRILASGRKPPTGSRVPQICQTWKRMTGDAGWAGVLAQQALEGKRPAHLIFPEGVDVLTLLVEAQSLLPASRRWEVSFSTYFTRLPQGVECMWRCVLADSPEGNAAAALRGELVIDLTQQRGPAPDGPLVHIARTGNLPPGALVPRSVGAGMLVVKDEPELIATSAARSRPSDDTELRLSPPPLPQRGASPGKSHYPTIIASTESTKRRRVPWTVLLLSTAVVLLLCTTVGLGLLVVMKDGKSVVQAILAQSALPETPEPDVATGLTTATPIPNLEPPQDGAIAQPLPGVPTTSGDGSEVAQSGSPTVKPEANGIPPATNSPSGDARETSSIPPSSTHVTTNEPSQHPNEPSLPPNTNASSATRNDRPRTGSGAHKSENSLGTILSSGPDSGRSTPLSRVFKLPDQVELLTLDLKGGGNTKSADSKLVVTEKPPGKSVWEIELHRRLGSVQVGTFRLESSTLVFEWSKQAANNSATGALLECLLSLSTNDNRKILIELGIPAYVESPQINDNYIISTSIGAEYERLILTSGSELVIRTPTTIRGLFGSKAGKLEGDKNYAEVGLPLRFHHPENHNIRFELALETGDSQKLLRGTFAVRNLALDGTKTPAFRAIIHQYREFHSKLLAARSKLQMAKDAQKDLATKLKHNLSGKEKEALEHKKAAADADVSNKQYDIHVAEQKKTDLKNHVEAKVSAILQDEGLVLTLGEMFMHDGATFPKIPVQICRRFVIDETDYLVPLVQFGNAAFE